MISEEDVKCLVSKIEVYEKNKERENKAIGRYQGWMLIGVQEFKR